MNPTELPLRDIHLPDPVGWWPPAPIWWIAALVLVIVAVAAWRAYKRRNAWRQSAVFIARGELAKLREDWIEHGNAQRLAGDLSTWLRRVVISMRTREQAASLTGQQWWHYLDELAGHAVFGPDGGRLVTEAPYRADADIDPQRLITLCERWLNVLGDRVRRERVA